jgi:hypothetical protein
MTSTFVLEQDGSALKGSMETPRGSVEFEGTVEGNTISFTIVRTGMGDRTFQMTYTGTVEGDTVAGINQKSSQARQHPAVFKARMDNQQE